MCLCARTFETPAERPNAAIARSGTKGIGNPDAVAPMLLQNSPPLRERPLGGAFRLINQAPIAANCLSAGAP